MPAGLAVIYRPIAAIRPYERNARTHSPQQIKQIAAAITEWGWTNPILLDEDGGILAGHGRLEAAKSLRMVEVPCIVIEGLSETQKRALVIADNKLALNGGWDPDMLAMELGDIHSDGVLDLSLIGFSTKEMAKLLDDDPLDPTLPELTPKHKLAAHSCPNCGHQWVDDDDD